MKRMLIRLSVLTSVVVLGLIAIAEAQRGIKNPNLGHTPETPAAGLTHQPPGPATAGETFDESAAAARDESLAGDTLAASDPFATRGGNATSGSDRRYIDSPPLDVNNPLAAQLTGGAGSAAEQDDFPTADEALGPRSSSADGQSNGLHDTDDSTNSGDPTVGGTFQIAQAPRPAGARAQGEPTPAPPAELPRNPRLAQDPQTAQDGREYNPIRPIDGSGAAPIPTSARDRYNDPPAETDGIPHATIQADPFPAPDRYGRNAIEATPAAALVGHGQSAQAPLSAGTGRDGTGTPGGKQLEGQQVPTLLIHKLVPEEIQVGRPAIFEIRVQNTGTVPAHGVEVHDEIPKGTQLMTTTPLARSGPQGTLLWEVGTLDPGDETTVSIQLMPTAEGEIGSVASVRFSAEASARTIATKPELAVEINLAKSVLIGEDVLLNIRITNPGSGVAANVIMEELVPETLEHEKGSALEYEIGDLGPGETREIPLTLTAVKAGSATNLLTVRADGNLSDNARAEITVVAPALAVDLKGPRRRFLDREATYSVSVGNTGTATARGIELVTYLPQGMKFVNANNQGQYDPTTRAVYWLLEELPPSESGNVTLTAVPTEPGLHKLRVEGTAEQGLSAVTEREITIEGVAAILFQVVDVDDPIEVGGETAYEIRVVNQGSKAADNVTVEVLLPAQMKPVAADGPTRYKLDGQRVIFDPLPRLAPKADTTYVVRAQAVRAGDLRLRVMLRTDDMETPVTKEESTRVFSYE